MVCKWAGSALLIVNRALLLRWARANGGNGPNLCRKGLDPRRLAVRLAGIVCCAAGWLSSRRNWHPGQLLNCYLQDRPQCLRAACATSGAADSPHSALTRAPRRRNLPSTERARNLVAPAWRTACMGDIEVSDATVGQRKMTKQDRRTWAKALITMLVILPGFPILMIVVGLPLAMLGLSGPVFMTCLTLGNLYFSIPALVFGNRMFPSEEFGLMPTPGGYCAAALLYGAIALALSFPIAAAIGTSRHRRNEGEGRTSA